LRKSGRRTRKPKIDRKKPKTVEPLSGQPDDIHNVKTTLAIVCSLLLAWTPIVPAQAPAAGVARVAHACCHCGKACCAVPSSPQSQPAPVAPVPALNQSQLLTLAPDALAWALPDAQAPDFSISFSSLLTANAAPLYARDCARLI
jgi:hypothetical protein